jgi:hypothetical protein
VSSKRGSPKVIGFLRSGLDLDAFLAGTRLANFSTAVQNSDGTMPSTSLTNVVAHCHKRNWHSATMEQLV